MRADRFSMLQHKCYVQVRYHALMIIMCMHVCVCVCVCVCVYDIQEVDTHYSKDGWSSEEEDHSPMGEELETITWQIIMRLH